MFCCNQSHFSTFPLFFTLTFLLSVGLSPSLSVSLLKMSVCLQHIFIVYAPFIRPADYIIYIFCMFPLEQKFGFSMPQLVLWEHPQSVGQQRAGSGWYSVWTRQGRPSVYLCLLHYWFLQSSPALPSISLTLPSRSTQLDRCYFA